METIIQEEHRGKADRHQRWARCERADLYERYGKLPLKGVSQRQAAKVLDMPRRTVQARPPKDITLTQDEPLTGGLCLVGIEPVRNSMVLGQEAQARDHDTWQALMAQDLEGLHCRVIQSTSDEAPGLDPRVHAHAGP